MTRRPNIVSGLFGAGTFNYGPKATPPPAKTNEEVETAVQGLEAYLDSPLGHRHPDDRAQVKSALERWKKELERRRADQKQGHEA